MCRMQIRAHVSTARIIADKFAESAASQHRLAITTSEGANSFTGLIQIVRKPPPIVLAIATAAGTRNSPDPAPISRTPSVPTR